MRRRVLSAADSGKMLAARASRHSGIPVSIRPQSMAVRLSSGTCRARRLSQVGLGLGLTCHPPWCMPSQSLNYGLGNWSSDKGT